MTLSKALIATSLTAVLVGVAPSAFAQHRGGSASHGRSVARSSGRVYSGRATVGPRVGASVRPSVRGYYRPYYSHVAPVHFYRPYYTFRPRVSLGFGLWAGYPLPYAYSYYDPFYNYDPYPAYGYAAPSVAPYATPPAYPPQDAYPPPSSSYQSQGSVGVQPGQGNVGGLSFEITPNDAQLFVDGNAVGTVSQFTPTTQPLGLPAGRHQIEVRAAGYQTMAFDVEIVAGQVIPYRGTLER